MIRRLAVFSALVVSFSFAAAATAQSAPRETEPRDSAPREHGINKDAPSSGQGPSRDDPVGDRRDQACDRVCTLEQKNAALEKYTASLRTALAARDAYIAALKKEISRLGGGGQ